MRYFQKLIEGVDVMPLCHALARQPKLWNADDVRATFEGAPQADFSERILLRFGKPDGEDVLAADRPEMAQLPPAKAICIDLMYRLRGSQLGRVVITRLAPGKKILPYVDVNGMYAAFYSQYHCVLQGLPGSLFSCGDETVNMLTGEVWWFDAGSEHMVMNNSKDDRIHMLVDIRIDP